jgi:hypothetical protein
MRRAAWVGTRWWRLLAVVLVIGGTAVLLLPRRGLSVESVPPSLRQLSLRDQLPDLLEELHLTTGAELGIQHAGFAKHTLGRWHSCKRYYIVDAWKHQENYADAANSPQAEQDAAFAQAKANVEPFGDVVRILRMWSNDAAVQVPDNSLDYVYVDARHDYCGVREDLNNWWPKLRSGGVFAGHDYLTHREVQRLDRGQDWSLCGNGERNEGAVKGAVDEFAAQRGVRVMQTADRWPSWYFRKQ